MEKISIALGNKGAGTAPVFATVEGGYFHEQGEAFRHGAGIEIGTSP